MYSNNDVKEISLGQLNDEEVFQGTRALNGLTQLLKQDWLKKRWNIDSKYSKSPIYIFDAIKNWNDWCLVKNIPRSSEFLQDFLKVTVLEPKIFEVFVAARIHEKTKEIELNPELDGRKLDLRFKGDKRWVYVEASLRGYSELFQKTQQQLIELAKYISHFDPGKHNYLGIKNFITDISIPSIKLWLSSIKGKSNANNKSLIYFSDTLVSAVGDKHPILRFVGKSYLCATNFVGNQEKGTVCIKVGDDKIQQEIRHEAKQLSKKEPGVIVLDLSVLYHEYPLWKKAIKLIFKPKINTRISAIVFAQVSRYAKGIRYNGDILINPYAKNPLSDKEISILRNIYFDNKKKNI